MRSSRRIVFVVMMALAQIVSTGTTRATPATTPTSGPSESAPAAQPTRPPLPGPTASPGSCVDPSTIDSSSGKTAPKTTFPSRAWPPLDQDECNFYTTQVGVVALCFSTENLQVRDFQAKEQLKVECSRGRVAAGYADRLFRHPPTEYCNASNTAKTGLFSFVPRSPIGTQNLLAILGVAISVFFAGCNNAPSPNPGVLPPAQTSPSPDVTGRH